TSFSRDWSSDVCSSDLFVLLPGQEQVQAIQGERAGAGYADTPSDMAWTNQVTQLAQGAILSCFTDGLVDQIGGAKNIAYGKQRLDRQSVGQGESGERRR